MRVSINSLSFSYSNKLVLKDLSFNLKSGDFLLIHGRNGSGKSTFIKCLLKINKVPDGMIFLDDIDINHIKRFYNIGFVPQKTDFNYEFPITVSEILTCAYPKKRDEYFYSIIRALDISNYFKENINNLSGGQLQRVFIARALLTKPKLLIMDEPTVGVDEENVNALHQILEDLKAQEITIILISHDIDFCKDIATHTLTLHDNCDYKFTTKRGSKWF